MRVEYTLPGLMPSEAVPSDAIEEARDPFISRLKFLPSPRGLNWMSLLHLDETPFNPASIDPPPRPPSLDTGDAAAERLNWMQMLDRLTGAGDGESGEVPASGDDRAVQRMLIMLARFQEAEDEIASRSLSEAEA